MRAAPEIHAEITSGFPRSRPSLLLPTVLPFSFGNPNSHNAPRSRCGAKSGLAAPGNGKTARKSARQIPAGSRLPGTESLLEMWLGRSIAPEQVSQAPGLREFRLAESEQILPLIGNRKPASDRTHWLQPAPCSSRRRSCPGGERGDRQSSVPADPTRHGHRPPAGG